jgi:trigger factor
MKVEVEKQPGSVSKLQIELPADEVAKEWDAIANSFARFAKIPGYRPGKAPRTVIDKRFRKEIQDELTKKLVSKGYHEAVEQEQLRVASLTNIEDVEFGEDKSMRFRATVVTAPEFELPDHKNIPVQLPDTKVSEAEVEAAIERLRDQSADFVDVPERALKISEIAPHASKNLQGGKKFWLHLAPENFLPKFCEQVIGLKPGETRLVIVNFPDEFPVKELAGKKADYPVTLREIKDKVLPPIDDALAAKLVPGKTLAALREMIEHDLEHTKEHDSERAKESQIVKYLHERIQVELPPALLQNETRRALAELVQRNRERGVTDDMLKEKEKELIDAAAGLAAHRLKTNFILHRIAERENIQVTKEDLDLRIRQEATRYDISPDKMRKELQQRDALDEVAEQLLLGKTLDFLKANVSIELTKEPTVKEENS